MRLIRDAWKARRWRDDQGVALAVVAAMVDGDGQFNPRIIPALPRAFFDANEITPEALAKELSGALDQYRVRSGSPTLIPIEEIDSFSRASEVSAVEVATISHPLKLPEMEVKRLVAKIIGEPYIPKDWGGEADDLFSTRVRLHDRPTGTTFIFKGPAKKGTLTLASLGANGDQLDRMLTQEASLFVVQHCDAIAASVRRHLARGIIALRAAGKEDAVGSVWDGSDCARLFLAHGTIDRATGALKA